LQTTKNAMLDGRVRLLQPVRGYRAGLDAALLAAACDAQPDQIVLDAGCGVGAVMLCAAMRRPAARFIGVDDDPDALALAQSNIAANHLAERVGVARGRIGSGARLPQAPFDAILSNPPFFDDPTALRGPAREKAAAWLTPEGLGAWVADLLRGLKEGGSLTLIHRADRLADILLALGAKAGAVQIRPIGPFADAPAKRVLVRAVKTARAPLRLLPALILHERDASEKHTPQTESVLRGEAALDWL
jgi:tRNA1(Val) A37 N6-methylase TrmN6